MCKELFPRANQCGGGVGRERWEGQTGRTEKKKKPSQEPFRPSPRLGLPLGESWNTSYASDLVLTLGQELDFHGGHQSVIEQGAPAPQESVSFWALLSGVF